MVATGTKQLQYRIGMDIGELRRNAEAAATYTRAFKRELDDLDAKQKAHRKSLADFGRGMATFGAATVAGLGLAAKAAIDWESAWTGVRKTVDGSDAEMAQLEGQLRALARTLPASHKEIAAVAEAAGQLGIKRKDIAGFTKTMIDLGETTNLTADEAATALAKFSNIMGTSADDADRLGATLVALGNDGASTEKDIVEMALRIAGAGKQLHLTEAQVLGLASALSSVGIEAEAGGSSISTTMIKIAAAVNQGGAQLDSFAKVAGMSGGQFAQSFKTDAGGAIIAFLQGLGRMQKSGEDVFGTLDNLGLSEIRVRDALLRAGSASNMFTHSLEVGSQAWEKNSALTDEANKRYQTSASKLQVAWNQIQDALIDVGAAIVPVVSKATSGIADWVAGFQALPGPVKDVVTWVGAAAGVVALFGGAAAIAVPKILAFRESMATMAATGGAITGTLGKLGLAMAGPWGAAIAAGTALLGFFTIGQGKAQSATAGFTYELDKQTNALSRGSIEALHKYLAEAKIGMNGLIDQDAGAKLTDIIKTLGLSFDQLIGYITATGAAQDEFHDKLWNSDVASGGRTLLLFLDAEREKYQAQTKEQREASKAADDFTGKTGKSAEGQQQLAHQLTQTEQQIKETKEALEGMSKALDEAGGKTLSARGAERSFRDSITDALESLREQMDSVDESGRALGERARTLDQDTAAGRKNADMLDGIAEKALATAKAVSEEAEAHNGAAAGAQAMVNSLEASRDILIDVATKFGMSRTEAQKYAYEVLHLPEVPPLLVTAAGSKEAVVELTRVRDALNKGATAQQGFNLQLAKTAPVAKTAKEVLDDLIDAMDAINGTSLTTRDARRRLLETIDAAKTGLKEQMDAVDANDQKFGERARTLDEHTEIGRKNEQALDDQARAALDLARAVAREAEANGGAAAGQAALLASLKASKPALIETAKMFGMNQTQAEAYANDVLAIPTTSTVKVTTPGAQQSQRDLQGVKDKADALPGQKWINVGVLSQTAIQQLEALGFKVKTLPDGTVSVQAPTDNAQRQLDNFINANQNRVIRIIGTYETFYQGQGGRYYAARGGIVAFAGGGMYENHRPQIATGRPGMVRMWAEEETDKESYIPWAMDRRREATGILRTTANGFGFDLVPQGIPARAFSAGGIYGGGSSSAPGKITWEVVGGDSELKQLLATVIRRYVRVAGSGNVQTAFGRRY